ncbi:MAG: cation diffusion facilitator family transporter [Nitrospiraceae bacterium]
MVDQGSLSSPCPYPDRATRPPPAAPSASLPHRAGVVAAFFDLFLLLLLTAIGILLVGAKRLLEPVPIAEGRIVALVSFAANLGIALLLQHGAKDDPNIRSAFWHMLADAWVSLGVVVSGAMILYTGWTILDPLISFFVVAAILRGSWPSSKNRWRSCWNPRLPA